MNIPTKTGLTSVAVMSVMVVSMMAATVASSQAWAQETVPPPASASPPVVGGSVGYFGEHGQIAISGDFKFNIMRESRSMGGGSSTSYEFQPALDYFVSTNVSVGGLIGIRKDPFGDESATTFLVGARGGYNLVLASALSLWIRGGLMYERQTVSGTDASAWALPLFINAPFLWHPTTHFFIGAGPFFSTDLVAKFDGEDTQKRTDIGLASTLGGYFGGL